MGVPRTATAVTTLHMEVPTSATSSMTAAAAAACVLTTLMKRTAVSPGMPFYLCWPEASHTFRAFAGQCI